MLETSLNDHEIEYDMRHGHLLDLHTGLSNHLGRTTAAQEPEAELFQAFGEGKEASLVVDGEKGWGGVNAAAFVHCRLLTDGSLGRHFYGVLKEMEMLSFAEILDSALLEYYSIIVRAAVGPAVSTKKKQIEIVWCTSTVIIIKIY